jgi:hypothetical protein
MLARALAFFRKKVCGGHCFSVQRALIDRLRAVRSAQRVVTTAMPASTRSSRNHSNAASICAISAAVGRIMARLEICCRAWRSLCSSSAWATWSAHPVIRPMPAGLPRAAEARQSVECDESLYKPFANRIWFPNRRRTRRQRGMRRFGLLIARYNLKLHRRGYSRGDWARPPSQEEGTESLPRVSGLFLSQQCQNGG